MLMKSLTSILVATWLLAAVVLLTPAAPVAAEGPLTASDRGPWDRSTVHFNGLLADLWQELLVTISAASCNAEDPCAVDACDPEFCPCDPDPCAEDACDPDSCDGNGGEDGGGNGSRFNPGG